jgi:hypothetical protein
MELTYKNAETANPSDKKQNWLTAFELQNRELYIHWKEI